jgi:hypothetical protein
MPDKIILSNSIQRISFKPQARLHYCCSVLQNTLFPVGNVASTKRNNLVTYFRNKTA